MEQHTRCECHECTQARWAMQNGGLLSAFRQLDPFLTNIGPAQTNVQPSSGFDPKPNGGSYYGKSDQ